MYITTDNKYDKLHFQSRLLNLQEKKNHYPFPITNRITSSTTNYKYPFMDINQINTNYTSTLSFIFHLLIICKLRSHSYTHTQSQARSIMPYIDNDRSSHNTYTQLFFIYITKGARRGTRIFSQLAVKCSSLTHVHPIEPQQPKHSE